MNSFEQTNGLNGVVWNYLPSFALGACLAFGSCFFMQRRLQSKKRFLRSSKITKTTSQNGNEFWESDSEDSCESFSGDDEEIEYKMVRYMLFLHFLWCLC